MNLNDTVKKAVQVLQRGGVIAYPTEAVFGLGCDPHQEHAIKKILQLKKRDVKKGLILIAANFQQLEDFVLVDDIQATQLKTILATWPGPFTWVFPAKKKCL